ncbi:hypothetical protein DV738_g1291, partial [Chaetothyriales sp. CBS 135597]
MPLADKTSISETYQAEVRARHAANPPPPRTGIFAIPRAACFHLKETGQALVEIYKYEGFRALFKGLGANLTGVVPARSTNFFVYGNGKRILNNYFNADGHMGESPWQIHVAAAIAAGIATGTATNPIWLVKTRMQLDRNRASDDPTRGRQYRNSWDCIKQTVRHEGIRGLYKGLTASYLGVTESTMQWVMYEQFKTILSGRQARRAADPHYQRTFVDNTEDFAGMFTAASLAKLIASALTYPHEVVRTRLRQAPVVMSATGAPVVKYTGLVQCFKLIFKEEGIAGLYGGMTPHLLRVAPSAGIMFVVYEGVLKLLEPGEKEKVVV